MDFVWVTVLVSILATIRSTNALGSMNTLAALWGSDYVTDGYYGVCAVQPETLDPVCVGNYFNYTKAPEGTALWAISGGGYFTCGLTYTFRNPVCWGDSDTSSNRTAQVLSIPLEYQALNYSSISSGTWHVCAVRNDGLGTVDCWGYNFSGETKPPSGYSFASVSSGCYTSYGLRTDTNESVLWGWNRKAYSTSWAPDPHAQYSALFAGSYHVCGIELNTNKALCWGVNNNHQCDAPTNYTFSSLASGEDHTCGILIGTHEVVCWGNNTYGQLKAPKGVPFSLISSGDWYTCGVRRDKESQITCWGNLDGIVRLNASQGLCQATCANDQYYVSRECPISTDKICMDCSKCLDGMLQSSPCHSTSDATCVPSLSPSPSISPSLSPSSHHKLQVYIIILVVLGGMVVLVFTAFSMWCISCRRKTPTKTTKEAYRSQDKIQGFSDSVLREATSNYEDSMLVGRGASCLVYKGKLSDGRDVAVKRPIDLERSFMFDQELKLLKGLNHSCLVNLVGYCKQQKILVFEFMENGSLFDCLFLKRSIQLDWKTRIKIAAQASKGLEYLHTYASPTIIHRDVKSANVLLDKDWNAHIADFGISLVGPETGNTHLSHTRATGTPGYVDPQYALTLQLTTKSDVYSFGVVLLELVTGKRAFQRGDEPGIVAWVSKAVVEGNIIGILDQTFLLPVDISPLVEVLELALQCVRLQPKERPSMVSVSHALEKCLQTLDAHDIMMSTSNLLSKTPELYPR